MGEEEPRDPAQAWGCWALLSAPGTQLPSRLGAPGHGLAIQGLFRDISGRGDLEGRVRQRLQPCSLPLKPSLGSSPLACWATEPAVGGKAEESEMIAWGSGSEGVDSKDAQPGGRRGRRGAQGRRWKARRGMEGVDWTCS